MFESSARHAFETIHNGRDRPFWRVGDQEVNVIAFPIELQQLAFKVPEHRAKALFQGVEMYALKDFSSPLGHEDEMCGEQVD